MAIQLEGGKRFGLNDPHDFLDKLEWEYESLMRAGYATQSRELSYHFMNFVVTAWHMTDWTYPHLPASVQALFSSPAKFQEWVKHQDRVLAACRDIATASKHFTVSRTPDPHIETIAMPAVPGMDFPSNRVLAIAIDGHFYPLDDFARSVITFWQCYLAHQGLLPP
jgi:hypothetical protein